MSENLKISTYGQGPDLVLLHGWAMHSGIWGRLVDVLASGFRVNLVDLPGHGVNRHVPLSGDLNEVAELILSAVPPAIWIGWSLGGLVTLAATLQATAQGAQGSTGVGNSLFFKAGRLGLWCGRFAHNRHFSMGLKVNTKRRSISSGFSALAQPG